MSRVKTIPKILYNLCLRVKSSDQADRTLGETLIILIGLLFGVTAFIALMQWTIDGDVNLLPIAFAAGWILPAYILLRMGHVQIGSTWITIGISGFSVALAATDTGSHGDFSLLLNYTLPLVFTPVLAALMIRPLLAITAATANCLAIGFLYRIWENAQSQISSNTHLLTGFVIPAITHFMLGVICALLAERLLRIKQSSDDQNTLFNAILEALPVGVAVHNPENKMLIFSNPSFEEFTGAIKPGALIQVRREPHNIKEPDNLALLPLLASEWPWQTALRNGYYGEFNAKVEHPDGRVVDLHEQTSPVYDEQDKTKLLYNLYVATDVSKEQTLTETILQLFRETEAQLTLVREINQRLTELDLLKGEFLANVSHELRTPLSIILAHTEVLKISQPAGSPATKNITAIYDATLHLRELVNDILDAAKLDSNQLLLDMRLIDIREPIQAAVKSIEVLAAQKQLRLAMTLPEDPVMVVGDERRLAQIALNLLSNAVKFTPHGTISIKVAPCKSEQVVWFSVEDTGTGIEPVLQSFLFERFVQIRPASGKRTGTGIGLSIARSLARMHGGEVLLDSSTPNRGSTFVCKIPLAPMNGVGTAPTPPQALSTPTTTPL
jgi:signal transduction histidine kinase